MKQLIYIIALTMIFTSCNDKDEMERMYRIMEHTGGLSNVTYKKIDSSELQLDVYAPVIKLGKEPWVKLVEQERPVLIYFHGGGWVNGDRTSRFLNLLPFLEQGWRVVNVDYRLLHETNLVGCLNDCIDAINWVVENSSKYRFDTNQIYLSGESAGGHLALLSGLVNKSELGETKIHKRKAAIKGIINWYGITHMERAMEFWNDPSYTEIILDKWEGDTEEYLSFTSPVNHISTKTTVPIISIHGDEDENVEIEQAISLHKELDSKRIKNKLITIEGKKHGDFSAAELKSIFGEIWHFLEMKK